MTEKTIPLRRQQPYILDGGLALVFMGVFNGIIFTFLIQTEALTTLVSNTTENAYLVYMTALLIFSMSAAFVLTMILDKILFIMSQGDENV